MKSFSYKQKETGFDMETIIVERKRKRNKQQIIFGLILFFILLLTGIYITRKILYSEFTGHIEVYNHTLRRSDDIYIQKMYRRIGDFVQPGDTLFSYIYLSNINASENISNVPSIVIKNRDLDIQYGIAVQETRVIKVQINELKRQIKIEDYNIKFGLSDHVYKLELERKLKEKEEELKSQYGKISVLKKAVESNNQSISSIGYKNAAEFNFEHLQNSPFLKELGLYRYSIALDSAIVVQEFVSDRAVVLRGENILELQRFNLDEDNVRVIAFVPASKAHKINRGLKAEIIVNNKISFSATVVSMGARTEQIPPEQRDFLSKEIMVPTVVLRIDNNQEIPFWTLVRNLPVKIRFNNWKTPKQKLDDFIRILSPKEIIIPQKFKATK